MDKVGVVNYDTKNAGWDWVKKEKQQQLAACSNQDEEMEDYGDVFNDSCDDDGDSVMQDDSDDDGTSTVRQHDSEHGEDEVMETT